MLWWIDYRFSINVAMQASFCVYLNKSKWQVIVNGVKIKELQRIIWKGKNKKNTEKNDNIQDQSFYP